MHSCNGSVGNVGSWVYWQWNFTLNRISPEVRLFLMEERELQKEICHKGLCIYWVDILLVFSWHLKKVHVSGREDVPQFPPSIALKLQQHLLALDIPLLLPDTSESKCYFPHPSQTIKIQPYVTLSTLCSSPVGRHCPCHSFAAHLPVGVLPPLGTQAQLMHWSTVQCPPETGFNCS